MSTNNPKQLNEIADEMRATLGLPEHTTNRPVGPHWSGRARTRSSNSSTPLSAKGPHDTRPCPKGCGRTQGTATIDNRGTPWYVWAPCVCMEQTWAEEERRAHAAQAAYAQMQAEQLLGDTGMSLIQQLRLDTFDPMRLQGQPNPYQVAMRWLDAIRSYGRTANYRDPTSPPAALYLYSAGKGRGKTHLAAGLAWKAKEQHKLTAFIEELSYLRHRWSCGYEQIDAVVALPADRAWLTVIDDMGQRGKTTESVSDVWYEVLNPRWLRAGWTIITSNWTPDELVARGTINDATHSRLMQMTGGHVIKFHGTDQRQAPGAT